MFNFPQRRVNNTYQIADNLTWRKGNHNFAFGADIRRTELNSDAAPNARPLITFNGAPEISFVPGGTLSLTGRFFRAVDLAAAGAASGFMQTLATTNSDVQLRFKQFDFYGQDTWRIRPRLSLSLGLRYEYNTVPRDSQRRIEQALANPALNNEPDLVAFLAGRTLIFDPDRKNFAPRIGIAYSPNWFGHDHPTVLRGGYGLFYDPPLGAVVSQSRNVFPNFFTVNFAGGTGRQGRSCDVPCGELNLLNPSDLPIIQPGSLNRILPGFGTFQLIEALNDFVNGSESDSFSIFGATLPSRQLKTSRAHQYSFSVEQLLSRHLSLSAAYVGTQGRNLLRFTTPNLGGNSLLVPAFFDVLSQDEIDDSEEFAGEPRFFGFAIPPPNRPRSGIGAVSRFETTGRSRYDSLQLQMRGRFTRRLQFQLAYTLSKTTDDVSDVFDLAGAFALPQNSLNPAGERAPANFDARHRFAYNYLYQLPTLRAHNKFMRAFFGGLQFAGLGSFQTGPPFTVNSTLDINLDGNLTDRLNTLNGLIITGNRRQPLQLAVAQPTTLLAPFGQDGQIGRNTFRAGSILSLNMAVSKEIAVTERQRLTLRMEIFNFINRANYGVPIRFLEFPSFGQADNTVTPARRVQFALKYSF